MWGGWVGHRTDPTPLVPEDKAALFVGSMFCSVVVRGDVDHLPMARPVCI
jgi:hypothetical protein